MDTLKELIAIAEGPEGAAAGFTNMHLGALQRMLADVELVANNEIGVNVYKGRLMSAEPITTQRQVKARLAAIKALPREELRDGMLALAAELKRENAMNGEAWKIVLSDYRSLTKLNSGPYRPVGSRDKRTAGLSALIGTNPLTMARQINGLIAKMKGLLEVAEYADLEFAPETAQNLRDDMQYLLARREELAAQRAVQREAAVAR